LRLGRALLALALLSAYGADSSEWSTVSASPAVAPLPSELSVEYIVRGHGVRLVVTDEACVVNHRVDDAELSKVTLNLRPPCHLLTWRRPPPTTSRVARPSDGLPVGRIGDPMAWLYPSAKGVVALAVIGDPVPEELRASNLYQLRERQGLHCASSVQGILLDLNQIRLSKKRADVGVFCAELGLEEKDFWILAHP
jgi:hypothetical protein